MKLPALSIFSLSTYVTAGGSGTDYSHDGQMAWPGECQTSMSQSPINVMENGSWESSANDNLGESYAAGVYHALRNMDTQYPSPHWIKMGRPGDVGAMKFSFHTEPEYCHLDNPDNCIKVSQFHYHVGESEHKWNDEFSFAEIHYVTYDSSKFTSLGDAVADGTPGNLRVFGFFVQEEPSHQAHDNTALHAIEIAQNWENEGYFQGRYPYPSSIDAGYARYNGGLTTPECNELVTWTVFKDPILISQGVANSLRMIPGEWQHNNRMVQPINERVVRFFRDTDAYPNEEDHSLPDHPEKHDDHEDHDQYSLFNDNHQIVMRRSADRDERLCLTRKGEKLVARPCTDDNAQRFFNRRGRIGHKTKCIAMDGDIDDLDGYMYPLYMDECSKSVKHHYEWNQAFEYSAETGCVSAMLNDKWCMAITPDQKQDVVMVPCMNLGERQAAWIGDM